MNPMQPSSSQSALFRENQRLRGELEKLRAEQPSGVTLDIDSSKVKVRNLKTPEVTIDRLDLHIPQMKKITDQMLHISGLVQPTGAIQLPSLAGLEQVPMVVEDAHLRVPQSTLNKLVGKLNAPGVEGLSLQLGDGGQVTMKGQKSGLLPVSFSVKGSISRESDEKVRFSLQTTKILGFLPVPRLMTDIFASLASHTLSQMNIEQDNGDFLINSSAFVPPNIQMGLKGLSSQDGYLIIDAGTKNQPAK